MISVSKWALLVCAACACACAQGAARESRTVRTAQGPVRGYRADGVFAFYGVPYATAPTGPEKFRAPLPGPVWSDTLEAVNKTIVCPQAKIPMLEQIAFNMQEDCLIANVFTPDTDDTNLPVLVYVHGGGFQIGWGDSSSPEALVRTKKIVGVTFNYRLGAHGFLCLGTEDAPGNAGIKDQVALLRWVKKNIASFGGNPEDVTIAGGSAGSASVDLLMLSDITKGLYNKVIPESATSIALYSIQMDPLKIAKEFARIKNVTEIDDLKVLAEFFKSASFDTLTTGQDINDPSVLFIPCLERNIGVETFLEEAPFNILSQGKYRKVPVLYGFDDMDGLLYLPQFDEFKDRMNDRFSHFLPVDLEFKSDEERNNVAKTVKEFYFADKPVSEETVVGYVKFYTDVLFVYPYLKSTELRVATGSDSIFLYEYSFPSQIPEEIRLKFHNKIKGAEHCAQSIALYGPEQNDTEAYKKMRETLREMWLNFITTGKPVLEGLALPAWPPVGARGSPHMHLGEEVMLKGSLQDHRFHFWDGIYKQYRRTPIPPS